ncbi:hypothetical protein M9H77_08501 [Catharanthus roseus]|uniref:Uncharacterized protein n=1 Tax=Catharanthus roseus TaxID=4058 RepID=A0ACC0BXZ2_CATRO|nr:hypothetical protein M9H77_08501 [Catharanthus roseus]
MGWKNGKKIGRIRSKKRPAEVIGRTCIFKMLCVRDTLLTTLLIDQNQNCKRQFHSSHDLKIWENFFGVRRLLKIWIKYFHQHHEEAENCVHPFPTRIFDNFLRIELKSREHKVTTYNPREGIYMVKSPIRVSSTCNNVHTLRLNNKFCSCEKWQTYTLSYSHVLAVCRENGSRTYAYVPEIYSRQTYRKTYQANFHLVLSENFWRNVPFNLTFYPPNMKNERALLLQITCDEMVKM